jgi:hypothetical protein
VCLLSGAMVACGLQKEWGCLKLGELRSLLASADVVHALQRIKSTERSVLDKSSYRIYLYTSSANQYIALFAMSCINELYSAANLPLINAILTAGDNSAEDK